MSKPSLKLALFWASGMALLLATHLLFLREVAGFHFDEAWAANFAHRIASEPGFWPIQAMSPYTSSWGHYVSALFFKCFGTSLFAFRASGIFCVALGVIGISLALVRLGNSRAAALLPAVVAFFPALVANHRFAIEINTFHVLCFGALCWGLATSRAALIVASIFLGVTSHVLFAAPALALVTLTYWDHAERGASLDKRTRLLVLCTLSMLSVFFFNIFTQIPEKDKSASLLIVTALCAIPALWPRTLVNSLARSASQYFELLASLLFVPAALLLLFFAEGSWSLSFFTGGLTTPLGIGLAFLAPLLCFFSRRRGMGLSVSAQRFAALTLIATAALAVKPAPRYFEIPLLIVAVTFAVAVAGCSRQVAATCLAIWIAAGSVQLEGNYFHPILTGKIRDHDFRFLIFHDGSSDTLPKQALAKELGAQGCTFDQVRSDDPRLMEPLRFLSYSDWPIARDKTCPGIAQVSMTRRALPAENIRNGGPQFFAIEFSKPEMR